MRDSDVRRDFVAAVPLAEEMAQLLPARPDVVPPEFTGREEGWPPRLRLSEAEHDFSVESMPGGLTVEVRRGMLGVALRDEHVRSLLGARFAHINTDPKFRGKGQAPDGGRAPSGRLIFFSHTHNVAVEVVVEGLDVASTQTMGAFRPPEGIDEIHDAIALARADRRLATEVEGLRAGAILWHPDAEVPGYGHRIMWVTFSNVSESDEEALFSAVVDLTNKAVLMTRREHSISSTQESEGAGRDR